MDGQSCSPFFLKNPIVLASTKLFFQDAKIPTNYSFILNYKWMQCAGALPIFISKKDWRQTTFPSSTGSFISFIFMFRFRRTTYPKTGLCRRQEDRSPLLTFLCWHLVKRRYNRSKHRCQPVLFLEDRKWLGSNSFWNRFFIPADFQSTTAFFLNFTPSGVHHPLHR